MTCNETLPALPGGVGVLSDRLAELSGQIAECGDILEEYRQIMTRARQRNIVIPRTLHRQTRKAMCNIKRLHTLDCLRLKIILMEQGYGEENACSLH